MNLRQKYTEETGKDANRLPYQSICSVTIDYVEWLEQQLLQTNVSGRNEQLCGNLDENYNCKNMCLTRCVDGNKFYK